MTDPARIATLKAMGIDVWVRRELRAATPRAAGQPAARRIAGPANAPVAVIVVWPGELRVSEDHQGGALLLKILDALEAPRDVFAVIHARDAARLPQIIARITARDPVAVLCFADERIDFDGVVVQLPSLGRMLRDGSAKKPAWAALKPLVGKLDGS